MSLLAVVCSGQRMAVNVIEVPQKTKQSQEETTTQVRGDLLMLEKRLSIGGAEQIWQVSRCLISAGLELAVPKGRLMTLVR
ncbi:MAG: hypothetical protein Q9215_006597 [Flavoplaca cf. flavocitrina]